MLTYSAISIVSFAPGSLESVERGLGIRIRELGGSDKVANVQLVEEFDHVFNLHPEFSFIFDLEAKGILLGLRDVVPFLRKTWKPVRPANHKSSMNKYY